MNKMLFKKYKTTFLIALVLLFFFSLSVADVQAFPINTTGANGLAVYGEALASQLRYRTWNENASGTNNFSVERNNTFNVSNDPDGNSINWVVVRGSHQFDQQLVAIQSNKSTFRNLTIAVVNGTRNFTNLLVLTNKTNNLTRSFDIAFEDVSGDALIVYENDTALNDANITFRTWNGTTFSAATNLPMNISGAINWTFLVPRVGTDDIMLVVENHTGAIWVIPWNGTDFLTSKNQTITTLGTNPVNQHFQFAWRTQSGDGVIIYGETDYMMRNYSASTNTWSVKTVFFDPGTDTPKSLRLCSDPTSNLIGAAQIDSGDDVDYWMLINGTTIIAGPSEDITSETSGTQNPNVDCSFSNNGTIATFVSVDNGALGVRLSNFTKGTSAFAPSTIATALASPNFASDDIEGLSIRRDPVTDALMFIAMDILNDNTVIFLPNGSTWQTVSASTPVTPSAFESSSSVLLGNLEAFMFDFDRYDPEPNVTASNATPTPVSQGNVVNISANVTDNVKLGTVFARITHANGTQENLTMTSVDTGRPQIYNLTFTNTNDAGRFNITIFANDTSTHNNTNLSETTTFIVSAVSDTIKPNVTQFRPVVNNFTLVSSIVNISVNVTDDKGVSFVFANITYPNNTTKEQLRLVNISGAYPSIFNFSFGNTSTEGYYNVTFIANDTSNNINDTEKTNFTVDSTGPTVATLRPVANTNTSAATINISATVTDQWLNVDVVLANVTYPDNSTKEQLKLVKVGNIYNYSFGNTTQQGVYNITFIANDTAGNLNTTEKTNVTMNFSEEIISSIGASNYGGGGYTIIKSQEKCLLNNSPNGIWEAIIYIYNQIKIYFSNFIEDILDRINSPKVLNS